MIFTRKLTVHPKIGFSKILKDTRIKYGGQVERDVMMWQ